MYKLMIIIPAHIEDPMLNARWPDFLHAAESMPGLLREASVRVVTALFGSQEINMVHELFFETLTDLQEAMQSPDGLLAGQIIQELTHGQMTLLVAEHREDDIENLRSYQQND
jgi:hypothetical protein